jgi:hypothetical protein
MKSNVVLKSNQHIMLFPELPYYLTVVATVVDRETGEDAHAVEITVHSRVHVKKEVTLPESYTLGYWQSKPTTVRSRILHSVAKRYGLVHESKFV